MPSCLSAPAPRRTGAATPRPSEVLDDLLAVAEALLPLARVLLLELAIELDHVVDAEVAPRLPRRSVEGESSVHQQHDRVAQVDVVERVGDQDHRLALVGELSEEQHQRFLQPRVEAARGLVEEKQAGLGEQLGRDRHPLALPSGKVVDGGVAPLAELQGGEDLVDSTGSFLRRRVRGQA